MSVAQTRKEAQHQRFIFHVIISVGTQLVQLNHIPFLYEECICIDRGV